LIHPEVSVEHGRMTDRHTDTPVKAAITGKTLVAGLEVRRQVVRTRLVSVQLGDRELADLAPRTQPVDIPQHRRRAADEA